MARYIRFQILTWHGHISMRAEVYGCPGNALCVRGRVARALDLKSGDRRLKFRSNHLAGGVSVSVDSCSTLLGHGYK